MNSTQPSDTRVTDTEVEGAARGIAVKALGIFLSLLLLTVTSAGASDAVRPTLDMLITGARVLDGTGNPWVHRDVGIRDDRIAFVGNAQLAGVTARLTLDASGLLLAPGFWDVHSHADLDAEHGRVALPLLYQGITTAVLGVDGFGDNNLAQTFAGYERNGIAVNAIHFVGHGAARSEVMGGDFGRPSTAAEIESMKEYVTRGLEEGAVGVSSGLAYNPGFYATTDEVAQVVGVAAAYGGVYDTHDRDLGVSFRGIGYLASVEEAIEIAERAHTPMIFSHFNALGHRSHPLVPQAVGLIEAARNRGVNVVAAQHVYTASQSHLVAHALPRWVAVGGVETLMDRLNDPRLKERLDAEILEVLDLRGGAGKIILSQVSPELDGRSVAELARAWEIPVPDAVRRLLAEEGPATADLNIDIYSMDNIRELAQKTWMMTCTDGGTPVDRSGRIHPRTYGAFTRKLRVLVQDEGVIPMPFAVRGMTSLPAQFFGVADRGLIKPGYYADLVILDESELQDLATYENPHQYSRGTVHVLVNGKFALRNGVPTGELAGRPIRRPSAPALPAEQSRTVTGRVNSGWSGLPLERAIVYLTDSFEQAVTNQLGEFSIEVPAHDVELLVQAVAYQENLLQLPRGQTRIETSLEPSWSDEYLRAMALQRSDPEYEVQVASAAYPPGSGPLVHIDEGHHNGHTATGRYDVFAELLRQDGFRVEASQTAFVPQALAQIEILVIATPRHGLDDGTLPTLSAFRKEEIVAVRDWVNGGGALLLIADHMPTSGSVADLLAAFDVGVENGFVVEFIDGERQPSPIVFHRSDGSIRPHTITRGLDSIATFTGFAFKAGDNFSPLLTLREGAVSLNPKTWWVFDETTEEVNVAGWSQGAAGELGEGRLVIIGEAAMFTAQIRGDDRRPNGLSRPEAAQNGQFLLNIIHWLSGEVAAEFD